MFYLVYLCTIITKKPKTMRLPLFLTLMLSVLYANAQCCSLSAEGNLMRDTDALSLQATPYFYSEGNGDNNVWDSARFRMV